MGPQPSRGSGDLRHMALLPGQVGGVAGRGQRAGNTEGAARPEGTPGLMPRSRGTPGTAPGTLPNSSLSQTPFRIIALTKGH